MPSGEEPVGKPSTNGLVGVGANDLMRPGGMSLADGSNIAAVFQAHTDDVVCDVLGGRGLVVPDD